MMRAFVIEGGVAANIITVPEHEPVSLPPRLLDEEGVELPEDEQPPEPEPLPLDLVAYGLSLGLALAPWSEGVSLGDHYDAATGLFSPPPFDIAAARAAKREEIDAYFLARNTADFPWDFGETEAVDDLGVSIGPAGVRALQMRDDQDKTNWMAAQSVALAAIALGAPATVVALKCEDNVWVQTTALQAQQVLALGDGPRISLFQRQAANLAAWGTLKKRTADAVDQAGLDAIDQATGYPPNLGEVE